MHHGKLINIVFGHLGGTGGIDRGKERLKAMAKDMSYAAIAKELTEDLGITIKRQNVRYWCRILDSNNAKAQRTTPLPQFKKHKQPKYDPRVNRIDAEGKTILFITDSHAPYHHRDLLEFYRGVKSKYDPDMVIHGGDEVDNHALSMHDSDPNLDAAGPELHQARQFIHALADLFPKMDLVESNHGSLVYRRAKKFGIPLEYIRTYPEVLFPGGAPEWHWHEYLRVRLPGGDEILFKHQHAGDLATGAAHEGAHLAVGHEHAKFGIGYRSSTGRQYWSLYAGCGIDEFSYAMAYGKNCANRPILGCAVIKNGVPHLVPMCLDEAGRWDRVVH